MLVARSYQQQAIEAVITSLESGIRRPLVVAPTGSGKSVMIAYTIKYLLDKYPTYKIIQLNDSNEITAQNKMAAEQMIPAHACGVCCTALKRWEASSLVTFATIQTIVNYIHKYEGVVAVIIDEAHKLRQANGRYQQVLKKLTDANPKLIVIGYTATPYRLDCGTLIKAGMFNTIVCDISVDTLIQDNYLVPLTTKVNVDCQLDTSNFRLHKGEFMQKEVEDAARESTYMERAIVYIIRAGALRKRWLIFAAGVNHAKDITQRLVSRGIVTELITAATPKAERDSYIERFRFGDLRAVVNVGVLTTGFDNPEIDMVVLLTATTSPGKYIQMCGRGTRTSKGKEDCLILDFGGNVYRHGMFSDVSRPIDKLNEKNPIRLKTCSRCDTVVSANMIQCPTCKYTFQGFNTIVTIEGDKRQTMLSAPYDGEILPARVRDEMIIPIRACTVTKYTSSNHNTTVKITFLPNGAQSKPYNQWFGFKSRGPCYMITVAFFTKFIGKVPANVNDCIEACRTLPFNVPKEIRVKKVGRYHRVVGWKFDCDYSKQSKLTISKE